MQATEALLIAIRAIPTILPFPLKGEGTCCLMWTVTAAAYFFQH